MNYFGPIQYQNEWLQALAKFHKEDATAVSFYETRREVSEREPGRDFQAEQIGALRGLYEVLTEEKVHTPIRIEYWTGREIAEQTGTKLVGSQYSTKYTIIVI